MGDRKASEPGSPTGLHSVSLPPSSPLPNSLPHLLQLVWYFAEFSRLYSELSGLTNLPSVRARGVVLDIAFTRVTLMNAAAVG